MAASIMWRHQKRQIEQKTISNVCNWLKSAMSLTVIMGLTWIVGLILVESVALTFLLYIYTFLVAFQGLFIFVIFVVFSKSVQDAIKKWWKIKVNESDFLSKYFGEKLTSSRMVRIDL